MSSLQLKQRALYETLHTQFAAPFFLRQDTSDSALWITDIWRRTEDISAVQKKLEAMGYCYTLNRDTRLLHIDMTLEGYRCLLSTMPQEPPLLPQNHLLHGIYALCRLMLIHPVLLEEQPMWLNRRVLKLCQNDGDELLKSVQQLHEECAKRKRLGQPLAHAGGRILAQWLLDNE